MPPERVPDSGGAVPDLALGDEHIAVFGPDQDVCLAGRIEHLTGSGALELGVQEYQEQVPDLLLIQIGGHSRTTLQGVAGVAQHG
jgi:hypothetical protein